MKKLLITILLLIITTSAFGQVYLSGVRKLSNLATKGDTVEVGDYYDIAVGTTGNLANGNEYFNDGQRHKIRQTGYITKLQLGFALKDSLLLNVKIKFWRPSGTKYIFVDSTENFVSKLNTTGSTITLETIVLDNPIYVEEGDMYSIYSKTTSSGKYSFKGVSGATGSNLRYVNSSDDPLGTYDWGSKTTLAGFYIPVKFYMTAPIFISIGNSIMAGHDFHNSYLESTKKTDKLDSTIGHTVANYMNYSYQNMGIGSETTTQILTRVRKNILNLKPRFAIVEGGVNDINLGRTSDSIINNYRRILDTLENNDITGVVIAILPWTNGTDDNMRKIDSINTRLKLLISEYPKFYYLDMSKEVGQYRIGGDSGNLWDIKSEYDYDGVHFTGLGMRKIAEMIYHNIN